MSLELDNSGTEDSEDNDKEQKIVKKLRGNIKRTLLIHSTDPAEEDYQEGD